VARITIIRAWPSPASHAAMLRASSIARSFASSLNIASSPRIKANSFSRRARPATSRRSIACPLAARSLIAVLRFASSAVI
jgi:hypothetical protein